MDPRPSPDVYDDEPWELAAAYRVTLWEQPASPNSDQPAGRFEPFPIPAVHPEASEGWEETTFELADAHDVREVIQWAETTLASGKGPASRRGVPVQDREYVVYVQAQGEDRWLHVAGSIPVLPPDSPLHLRRLT